MFAGIVSILAPLRQALLRIAYANITIAATALGWAAVVLVLSGHALTPAALFLPFATTFAVYTIDKVVLLDPSTDVLNDPTRTSFLLRWRLLLIVTAAVLFAAGAIIAARHSILCLVLFVAPIPIGLLYGAKILPATWRFRRLKEITVVKNLVVALTFAVISVALPLVRVGHQADGVAALLFAYIALRMQVNTCFFDVGDLHGDRAAGVATVPVVLGLASTRRLLHAINLASMVLLLLLLERAAIGIAFVGAAWTAAYLHEARDEDTDLGFVCDVIADAEGVVQAAAAVALA